MREGRSSDHGRTRAALAAARATLGSPDVNTTGNTAKDYCLQHVAALARVDPELVVVDLGCGDGLNVEPLLQEHPSIHYVGIDPSERAITAGRERLAAYDAELQVGRAYDVQLADADVVLSFSVLEDRKSTRLNSSHVK